MSETRAPTGQALRLGGFTLIELMTVVAVMAILVTIAVPNYQDAVRKGRRGQAKADLVELAQRAERHHTVNNTYNGFSLSSNDQRSPRTGDSFHYDVSVEVMNGGRGFSLSAVPRGAQRNDARCMALGINQAGQKTISGSGTVQDCW